MNGAWAVEPLIVAIVIAWFGWELSRAVYTCNACGAPVRDWAEYCDDCLRDW